MSLKQWGHPGFLTGFLFSDVECFSGIEVLHPGLRFFLFLFPPFFFLPHLVIGKSIRETAIH